MVAKIEIKKTTMQLKKLSSHLNSKRNFPKKKLHKLKKKTNLIKPFFAMIPEGRMSVIMQSPFPSTITFNPKLLKVLLHSTRKGPTVDRQLIAVQFGILGTTQKEASESLSSILDSF